MINRYVKVVGCGTYGTTFLPSRSSMINLVHRIASLVPHSQKFKGDTSGIDGVDDGCSRRTADKNQTIVSRVMRYPAQANTICSCFPSSSIPKGMLP